MALQASVGLFKAPQATYSRRALLRQQKLGDGRVSDELRHDGRQLPAARGARLAPRREKHMASRAAGATQREGREVWGEGSGGLPIASGRGERQTHSVKRVGHVELRAVGALEHAQLDVLGQNAGEQPLGEERVFVQKLRTRTSSTKKAGERERRSRV